MSRPAKRNGEFNKEAFADLLKKAKGDNKQGDFADSIPMSRTYFSAFIQARNNRPLMPSMLEKIANASGERVTYEELLRVSGYDPDTYMRKDDDNINRIIDNRINAIITGSLINAPFEWTAGNTENYPRNILFDLEINIKNNESIDKWLFDFYCFDKTPTMLPALRLRKYGQLSEIGGMEKSKISLVTHMPEIYNNFINHKPVSLNLFLSIILVDFDNFTVKSEEYLSIPPRMTEFFAFN